MEFCMSGEIYTEALSRLDKAAAFAKIDQEAVEILKHPNACLEVSIPVRMDDGSALPRVVSAFILKSAWMKSRASRFG
jgi:glutamate dehydrogenase/leucine dehydrogenase